MPLSAILKKRPHASFNEEEKEDEQLVISKKKRSKKEAGGQSASLCSTGSSARSAFKTTKINTF